MRTSITKAVIYARVSTHGQAYESDSLTNQLIRCQDYANDHGLEVLRHFSEYASGRLGDRKELQNAYRFCAKQGESMYLLVKDISRFMRSLDEHEHWKEKFLQIGVQIKDVESNSISYISKEDDPDAYLKEKRASLDAEGYTLQNAKKVTSGMLARLEQGGWPFNAPVGYVSERIKGIAQVCPHDVNAPLVKEMLERLARGEIHTLKDAEAFLLNQGLVNGDGRQASSSHDRISNILKRLSFYAGYIEHDMLAGRRVRGLHDALIDEPTWRKIEERLPELKRAPRRASKKCDLEFPLLGHLYCEHCGERMYNSASSSKGRPYNYYLCKNKSCERKGKNVSAKKVEQAVCDYLSKLKCTPFAIEFMEDVLEQELNKRLKSARKANGKLDLIVQKREETKGQMLERLCSVNPKLAQSMETQILKVDDEISRYKSRRQLDKLTADQKQELKKRIFKFFSELDSYWASTQIEGKKIIIHSVLGGKLSFHATQGVAQHHLNKVFTPEGK